jgi:galactose-1-phosphate uridylyltransferase
VVSNNDPEISEELYKKACEILRERGHTQVIVYSPQHNKKLDERYVYLGMQKGNEFTAYWTDI